MSNVRVDQLPTASTLTGAELLPIEQSGVLSNITVSTLYSSVPVSPTLPTITATVASNTMTVGVSSQILSFRSSTLASGIVTTITAAPVAMVVPTNTTLGTVSAQQSQIVVIEMNNAGTAEMAVANLASGADFSETGLVSTYSITNTSSFTGAIAVTTGILTLSTNATGNFQLGQALSGSGVASGTVVLTLLTGTLGLSGSTYSTNTILAVASTTMTGVAGYGIYSAVSRSNLAYRVVGVITSTQATAGIWATAPSSIQGTGGQAFAAMQSLGYGQTWQNLTGSRSQGTTYYNTTARAIEVSITVIHLGLNDSCSLSVNGVLVAYQGSNWSDSHGIFKAVIPSGASYTLASTGAVSIYTNGWAELR